MLLDPPEMPGDDEAPPVVTKTVLPTPSDPLRGLRYLGPIAIVGRQRLLDLARTPIEYVWQDIAVAGTIILIAGPPAEGKTTLLFLILAARLSTKGPTSLLERQLLPGQRDRWMIIIEGEHSEASASRKLVKSLALLGISDDALARVIMVARKAVRLGSPEWLDVEKLIRIGLVSDVAIDTIARVAPAEANDEREQVAIFDAVARAIELAPQDGTPAPLVWAVAHTRKNGTTGDLADVSGSAQRTGQADTVLLLKGEKVDGRTVSTTVVFGKLREDPDEYPLPVTFAITADGLNQAPPATDDRPLEERIAEALETGAKTKEALRQATRRSGADVDKALSKLFSARRINTTTVMVRGKETKAFELRKVNGTSTEEWTDS